MGGPAALRGAPGPIFSPVPLRGSAHWHRGLGAGSVTAAAAAPPRATGLDRPLSFRGRALASRARPQAGVSPGAPWARRCGRGAWGLATTVALSGALGCCRRQGVRSRLHGVRYATAVSAKPPREATEAAQVGNFVEGIVAKDNEKGTYSKRVHTRFPPEPNGYLHIGHAKSICLNFGIARKFNGSCNLRFDDTNPASEKQEYIDSIMEDVKWLGFDWLGDAHYASDYFPQLHDWAKIFIERDLAYVDELSPEDISKYRGSLTTPGKDSPYRSRPTAESLELFERMRAGDIAPEAAVLRAKIDMAHRNVIMRDPIMYRILHEPPHPRTKDAWKVYPSYDWAHGLSDAIEHVTHSVCTLEFNMHNELYDWFNNQVHGMGLLDCSALPRQHEFARLEMTHIVVSKRKLRRLIDGGLVEAWNDPRMPTLSGMRRRGYPAAALRKLCELIGVTKVPTAVIEFGLLESCVREACKEEIGVRLLCVQRPLRVVITNYTGDGEVFEADHGTPGLPTRQLPFGREILIDRDDFMEHPEPGFKRLTPGGRVKLRYGYLITCDEVIHDDAGKVVELHCSYDPESASQKPPKKVGVVHWVHASKSVPVVLRLYDRLFADARPEEREDFLHALNPDSLEELADARCEPAVEALRAPAGTGAQPGGGPLRAQFERCGYFVLDPEATSSSAAAGGPAVFNRTVTLNESWKPAGQEGPRRTK